MLQTSHLAFITGLVCLAAGGCKYPYPGDVFDDATSPPDGGSCAPDSATCSDGKLTACDRDGRPRSYIVPNGGADGSSVTVTLDEYECPLGCDAGGVRCADVAPANGLGPALDAADLGGPDIVIDDASAVAVLTTTNAPQNGSVFIIEGGGAGTQVAVPAVVVPQVNGPEILVLSVRSFTLARAVKLSVVGTRALAIVSHVDIYIAGTLDASGSVWGPGTSAEASRNVVGQNGALGGAGNQHDGGASSTGVTGGINLRAHSPALSPLEGGCSSGQVASLTGGGGVQLVSRTRIALGPGGVISVAGRAGRGAMVGGQLLLTGGGAGGAVLLEAPTIVIDPTSRIVGRGGSGAAANTINNAFQNGVSGDADLQANSVPGATCTGCGVGGNGGTPSAGPTSGQGGGTMVGSGGGGAGRSRLATRTGFVFPPAGTMLIVNQTGPIGIR